MSRTLVRVLGMGVLAAGPGVAALLGPQPSTTDTPPHGSTAPLVAAPSAPVRWQGPVPWPSGESSPQGPSKTGNASSKLAPVVVPQSSPDQASAAGEVPTAPSDPPPRWVEHTIADGDSLPELARRYLGDPDRAEEIWQWNCDRLSDPEMLPVGERLLILVEGWEEPSEP